MVGFLAPACFGRQEIELNTGDFKASSAFAEGLLSCAARAGQWLQRVRVVQALPGRGCTPKVVYGESGTRLEMYRGAQVCRCCLPAITELVAHTVKHSLTPAMHVIHAALALSLCLSCLPPLLLERLENALGLMLI